MNKTILVTAALLGMLSVVLGAFAAHGLKDLISTESLHSFETGARYQMYYAILLLFVGSTNVITERTKRICFYLTVVGLLLFSGSIYGLATNELTPFNFKRIALITPVGGLLLIITWVVLLIDFFRMKGNKN